MFGPDAPWRGCVGLVQIQGATDNQGNKFVVDKYMSTSYPLNVVLMELAMQLDSVGAALSLQWVPREFNAEADALTNEDFSAFGVGRRIYAEFEDLPLTVLRSLMPVGKEVCSEAIVCKRST